MNEIGLTNDENVRIDEVKTVVTLRSGKELRPTIPAPAKSAPTVADPPQEEQSENREEVKNSVAPPFQSCAHHIGEAILSNFECHNKLLEWGYATHIWEYDLRTQYLSFE